jgi:tripartite-type tricarboxylate transporter receptor subunit TctC
MNTIGRILKIVLSSLILIAGGTVVAQTKDTYPSKMIKMVVPFPPGGATDILARAVSDKLSVALGQPVIIENKPGAAANIGAAAVAKAAPDGYTLLMGALGSHSVSVSYAKNIGYDIRKDLEPISMAGMLSNVVVVSADMPVKKLGDLVALAKAQPGKYTCGSSGTGGLIHLTCEMFKLSTGIDVLHVPYKGTAPLIPDLVAGRVTVALDTLPPYMALIKSGKLKALAVTTARRSPLMPDVPTVAEAGYPGFESVSSYGLLAPAGTPPAIVQRLNHEVNIILKDASLKEKLLQQGIEAQGSTPEALRIFINKEVAKWARVIADSHIQPE